MRELPATKVILVTGSDAAGAVRLALEAGCVGYLAKLGVHSKLEAASVARDNGLVRR